MILTKNLHIYEDKNQEVIDEITALQSKIKELKLFTCTLQNYNEKVIELSKDKNFNEIKIICNANRVSIVRYFINIYPLFQTEYERLLHNIENLANFFNKHKGENKNGGLENFVEDHLNNVQPIKINNNITKPIEFNDKIVKDKDNKDLSTKNNISSTKNLSKNIIGSTSNFNNNLDNIIDKAVRKYSGNEKISKCEEDSKNDGNKYKYNL